MDNHQRMYREVETTINNTVRGVGGTDLKDRVGNASSKWPSDY